MAHQMPPSAPCQLSLATDPLLAGTETNVPGWKRQERPRSMSQGQFDLKLARPGTVSAVSGAMWVSEWTGERACEGVILVSKSCVRAAFLLLFPACSPLHCPLHPVLSLLLHPLTMCPFTCPLYFLLSCASSFTSGEVRQTTEVF